MWRKIMKHALLIILILIFTGCVAKKQVCKEETKKCCKTK